MEDWQAFTKRAEEQQAKLDAQYEPAGIVFDFSGLETDGLFFKHRYQYEPVYALNPPMCGHYPIYVMEDIGVLCPEYELAVRYGDYNTVLYKRKEQPNE